MDWRLRRASRLRSSREFRRVAQRGRREASANFVLLVADGPDSAAAPRLGLTVSRRVGGAVVRNRVKRRLRHWFRHSGASHGRALDWVVIARPGAARLAYTDLAEELAALSTRVQKGWAEA